MEKIILSILKENLDFSNSFSEFLVLILSILKKESKEKLFILFLTLISKLEKTPSILFFPFFSQIDNIFKNFKISYKIVLKNFEENEKDCFVKNSLPHFLAKFGDQEFSIFSNDFIFLVPAIIHGLAIEELSCICSNILEFIFNSFEVEDIVKKFEPELVVSKTLYDRFCSILEEYVGDKTEDHFENDENNGYIENDSGFENNGNDNNFKNYEETGVFKNNMNENFENMNNFKKGSNLKNEEYNENVEDNENEEYIENEEYNEKIDDNENDQNEQKNTYNKNNNTNNYNDSDIHQIEKNLENKNYQEDLENRNNQEDLENKNYQETFENETIENNNYQNFENGTNHENIFEKDDKNEICKNSLDEGHSFIIKNKNSKEIKKNNFIKEKIEEGNIFENISKNSSNKNLSKMINSELIKIEDLDNFLEEEKNDIEKKNYNLKERRREKKLRKQKNKSIEKNYKSQNFENLNNFEEGMISKEINNFSTFNFEINKEKMKLENEKKNHKKTLSQLFDLNKKHEELKFEIINLKKNFKKNKLNIEKKNLESNLENKINENLVKDIDKSFLALICSKNLTESFFEKIITEFEKKEDYEKEKYIFDLKFILCDTNKNIFEFIKKDNYKNLLKIIIKLIVKENNKKETNNITTLLQIILDKALKIKKIDQILISLINIIKEKLPNFKNKFENFEQIVIKLALKCFEKVIEIYEELKKENLLIKKNYQNFEVSNQNLSLNSIEFSSFELLLTFYELFDLHKPEELNDTCENLEQFDEVFRILRFFSDKIVLFDLEGSKAFLEIFGAEEKGIFIKYMKKYLEVLEDNKN